MTRTRIPAAGLITTATDRILGRASAGAGPVEEIACTAADQNDGNGTDSGHVRVYSWKKPKVRKKEGYWIPTENEWYKAAYYDPTLNNGSGGYWSYATRSNTGPTPVSANAVGDGSAGNVGNFANFNNDADWNGQDGNVTAVGSNGGPSYYGTYDQTGNVYEWNDLDGTTNSSRGLRGGSWTNTAFDLSSSFRNTSAPSNEDFLIGFRLASILNPLNLPNFVTVGNSGNNNDATGYGAVDYTYQIGKYEVTNDEYVEFLNAVASYPYNFNLYNNSMTSDPRGGIIRNNVGIAQGEQVFGDYGVPTSNTGNIRNSTVFVLDNMVSSGASSGYFTGLPVMSETGSWTIDINNHSSLTFYHPAFGTFQSSKIFTADNRVVVSQPSFGPPQEIFFRTLFITGTMTGGTLGELAPGPIDAQVSVHMMQTSLLVAGAILSINKYSYESKPNMGNKPVNYVNWLDCARYCNWLTNGKPAGPISDSTTESGIYPLYGSSTNNIANKNIFKINTNSSTNSANYNQPAGSTLGLTNVGTNGGPSYYGTYDQFGLAAQWTSTPANSVPNSSFADNWILFFSGTTTTPVNNYFDDILYIPGTTTIFREARIDSNPMYGERFGQSARICSDNNFNNIPDMVLVANINNPADTQIRTLFPTVVSYEYYIGKYLITVKDYLDFLNATASADIYQCYNDCVDQNQNNSLIIRNGSQGSYTYSTDIKNYNLPFNLKYSNLARYCNWLHNNKPTGNQDSNTTENGAYNLNNMYSDTSSYYIYPSTTPAGSSSNMPLPTRQANAKYWIPTAGEWYKAACYDPTLNNGAGGYWSIPTRSNTLPRRITNKKNNNDGIIHKFAVKN